MDGDEGVASAGAWHWLICPEGGPAAVELGADVGVGRQADGAVSLRIGHPDRYPGVLVLPPGKALELADRLRAAATRRIAG